MNFPKYHGNYLGIVIQNNDPQKRGRVKVYVPHVSPSVYKKWIDSGKDNRFRFLGKNINSDLTVIIDDLKKILPWAEVVSPLASESSSGRYNAFLNIGTISDSSDISTAFTSTSSDEVDASKLTQYSQNKDNIGEKPGNVFDISYFKLKDAFSDPAENNINNVNKFSFNYTPESYSNSAKGIFPILSVGAHVWVFFNNGDPLKPVIFGSSFGQEDWNSITNAPLSASVDYPGTFENTPPSSITQYDVNVETYRNKYVINQKSGTLAFINTDNREILKLTHCSGSFKEFNNFTNIEFANNNSQELILNDKFSTVRGSRNSFTQLDNDTIIVGDNYKKIGNLKINTFQQWKDALKEIANIKQLFDIKRADKYTTLNNINLTSTLQSMPEDKDTRYDSCPVCNKDINTYFTVNNSYKDNFKNEIYPTMSNTSGDFIFGKTIVNGNIVKSVEYPGTNGTIIPASPLNALDGSVDGSTGKRGPGYILGLPCPVCNPGDSNKNNKSKLGKSTSSQGGNWPEDQEKQNIKTKYKEILPTLITLEKEMGIGGSEIIEITKHKVETIGTVMNDFSPIRVDLKGKMYISNVKVGKYGTFYNRTPSPLVELVHVDDLPGGNYNLNVANKYSLMVGAGGLNIKSYGVTSIGGAVTNISGEQINIGSELETNIDGGKRLSLVGDIVSIRQREKKQVLIEGSLGVTNNVVVAGGLHVEGELTANHITMPAEIQATEQSTVYGSALPGKLIGFGVPLASFPVPGSTPGTFSISPATSLIGGPYMGAIEQNKVAATIPAGATITGTIGVGLVAAGVPVTGTAIITLTSPINVIGNGVNSIKGSQQGIGGTSASTMAIAVYGTGAEPDSIAMAPHSHMYKGLPSTLTDTNMQTREKIIDNDAPIAANPVSNYKK